jgi:predicted RNase H-like HicB family nuclease
MADISDIQLMGGSSCVAGFGKLFFIKKYKHMPALPDMKLLILKEVDGYQAICIDLEIDSVGETVEEACKNLKKSLYAYIEMSIEHFPCINDAVTDIINTAYSHGGTQKGELFALYVQAKRDLLMEKIKKHKELASRKEAFRNALSRLFQIEPIHFELRTA